MLGRLAVWWLNRLYLFVGNFVIVPIMGQLCVIQVAGTDRLFVSDGKSDMVPSDSIDEIDATILVDTRTKIYLSDAKSQIQEMPNKCNFTSAGAMANALTEKKVSDVPRLGGLSRFFAALKEIIMFSLLNENPLLPRYKGVLLYGSPGTGKTSLVSSCVLGVGANLFSINGPEIVSQYYGESEQTLYEVFVSVSRAAPAVESLEISEVPMAHFETGIGRVHPSDLQFYKELAAEFRRFVDTGSVRDEVSWLNS